MPKRSILVLGRNGQLASAMGQLKAIAGHPIISIGRPIIDLARPETIKKAIKDIDPALVINTAAYTAVDKAECELDIATAVNANGVGSLGQYCAHHDIPTIHISTDYVFDGQANTPYKPEDKIAPQGVYGRSKAEGESKLRSANEKHLIFRTAWVYSEQGNNFLKTMMRLGQNNDPIRVVNDQTGTPTYAGDLALGLSEIAAQVLASPQNIPWGTYHLTNSGETTWYGFAEEIFGCLANQQAHSPKSIPGLIPITTKEYPTPAARPAYSVLDCSTTNAKFGIELPAWENATMRCIEKIEGKD
jgi:dTDP-4-dehydrorhamnose reductase